MIKVGIAGADTSMAGELIRILVNHPDVEIISVCAPGRKGERVDHYHHGLAGECDLRFSEFLDPEQLDLVFIDAHSALANHFRNPEDLHPGLRVIDMSHGEVPRADSEFVYALSELNRKPLVREATRAVVPRSIAALALIALAPMAFNLMLPAEVKISVSAPADIMVPEKLEMARREISYWLPRLQSSFSGNVVLDTHESEKSSARGLRVRAFIPTEASRDIIEELIAKRYDDHNFTHCGDFQMDFSQVEGTDKCLLSVSAADGGVVIEGIADCRMRGGAGDAVHAMNLMFDLCETTGLQLKANCYERQ